MENPTVTTQWSSGLKTVYEFETEPTQAQMDAAMDHLGGKPKRGVQSTSDQETE
jgi:hypothetical protein